MENKVLYHGSRIQGLKQLNPRDAGYEASLVYAVTELAFAAISINRPGGSWLASWGRLENGIPYYCERKEGIFDKNYKNISGSIYVLSEKGFIHDEKMWKEEWISKSLVKVIKEIKIKDVKEFMQNLQRDKKLKIIKYEDRLKFFPDDDEKVLETYKDAIKKYDKKLVIKSIKKHRPDLLEKLI